MSTALASAVADLEREIASLPAEDLPAAAGDLARLHGLALARIVAANTGPRTPEGDRLLNVREAAEVLGVNSDWVYRHHADLPFTVRLPGDALIRFSAEGLQKWIRNRVGT